MRKNHFYTLLFMLIGIVLVSCSNDDEFNPFNEDTEGEFNPTTITFHKSSDNMETIERWSDIERDKKSRITAYTYTREVKGYINETETRDCRIDYYSNHNGGDMIRTRTDVEFSRIDKEGIEEKYTEHVEEKVSMNKDGYIAEIQTTTDRLGGNMNEPATTTSSRTFAYSGDLCTESTYKDDHMSTTYKYSWNAYQLKRITIIKNNRKDNTVDHSTYNYTFDKREFYRYSATEILPFVQSGFPQIFASMGYLGKFTPYILDSEVQGGNTDYGDGTGPRPKTEIRNSYSFNVDSSTKLVQLGVSNIYNAYSVTFSK